jgi:23S rRNA G2069 N7-methylase RlmK/C1962 C5-methylase RlmI
MYEMKKYYYLLDYVDHINFSPRLIQLIVLFSFTAAVNPMKVCSTWPMNMMRLSPASSYETRSSRYRSFSKNMIQTFILATSRVGKKSYLSSSSSSSLIKSASSSEEADTNTSNPKELTSTTSHGKSNSHYQIVLRRNQQSRSFREGNPLCFSGSILYAAQLLQSKTVETGQDGGHYLLPPPSVGSFVSVSVSSSTKSTQLVEDLIQSYNNDDKKNMKKKGNKNKNNNSPSTDVTTASTAKEGQTTPYFILTKTCILNNNATQSTGASSGKQNNLHPSLYADATQASIIGYGIYNPNSMYRVRILCHQRSDPLLFQTIQQILLAKCSTKQQQQDHEALQTILEWKLLAALQCRTMIYLPSNSTDTFRWINGEGDGLSGLCIDVIGMKAVVVMSSAAWVEIYKDTVQQAIRNVLVQQNATFPSTVEIIWRSTPSRLQQDGYYTIRSSSSSSSSNENDDKEHVQDDDEVEEDIRIEDIADESTKDDVGNLTSDSSHAKFDNARFIIGTESNIKYKISPWSGQKTGFYCDQRDNRQRIASLCNDKHVLDLCCYTGGFALNAAINGGATFVLGVDSSQEAIDRARENAYILNDLSSSQIQFERADIGLFMKKAFQSKKFYDVVILDPPKLAPSVSALDRSSRKYATLNRDAIQLVNPSRGGLLLTCTCSAAMTQREGGRFFLQTVQSAAMSAQRHITLLQLHGAAPCHTLSPAATYPSGAYLTAALFFVSPIGKTEQLM